MFPNPADNWLQKNIDNQNAAAKQKAANDLATYLQNLKQWQDGTIHSRTIGAAISAAPALPTITIFFDAGGWINSRVEVNPEAPPPTLPPMPKTSPDQPAFGGTGADARDRELFRLLYAIFDAVKPR